MAGGLLTTVGWNRLPVPALTELLDIEFVSLAAALLVTCTVSLVTRRPD